MCSNKCAKPLRPLRLETEANLVINTYRDDWRGGIRRDNNVESVC